MMVNVHDTPKVDSNSNGNPCKGADLIGLSVPLPLFNF